MVYMRRVIHLTALVSFVILLWACLVLPAAHASAQGGSISGKVAFNTGQAVLEGTVVKLVNGSNASEHIPGFNATPDENGFFQFTKRIPRLLPGLRHGHHITRKAIPRALTSP